MTRGFSLLEVLAATVVLGLLAVAVVPMTRRLVGDDGHLQHRLTAQDLIRSIDLTMIPASGIATPLAERSGWWVRAERLTPSLPLPEPGRPERPADHRWRRIQLVDGSGSTALVLAERLVMESQR